MEKTRVLIVDDDPNINQLIMLYLEKEGYETETAERGDDALNLFKKNPPQIVLLDLMLPGMDGWQVCREIRKISTIPIIMLTAKDETFDKVLGLELGADDYMTKPFAIEELLARIRVNLKKHRVDRAADTGARTAGKLRIEPASYSASFDNEPITLTKKEFDLLLLFARNPNTALYRETIYERVWGGEFPYGSRAVDLLVQRLRKKVGWDRELKAVNKVGYRLEVPR